MVDTNDKNGNPALLVIMDLCENELGYISHIIRGAGVIYVTINVYRYRRIFISIYIMEEGR